MAEHFCSIFPRRESFIWKGYDQERWQKAKGPLLDHQILGVVSDQGRGLFRGCYWSHKTKHAVLDIDLGSKYYQAAELQKLQEKLAAVGLSAKPYQSSASGGWHVYLFFDDWEDSSQVETILKAWLKSEKYSIECGQLEVFPSGNALRLPLQPGFAWLDPEGNLVLRREEIREDEALASFLCDLEESKRNWSEAKNRIESQLQVIDRFAGAGVQEHRKAIELEGFDRLWNSGQIPERMEEARYYLDNGLTEEGKRHAAVYAIQHLLWFGDRARGIPKLAGTHNNEKRSQFVRLWLEENHNGRSWNVNRGHWRIVEGHIRRAVGWRRQDHQPVAEYVPYMVTERAEDAMIRLTKTTGHLFTPEDLERANQKREEEARERIRAAVQLLKDQDRRVTVRQLMRLARCCNKTIKRHSDIYQISPVVALPSVGGDLDPGGAGALPALGCSCSEEENFLSSPLQGDSGQTSSSGCWMWDEADLEPAAPLCSAEAPPSPPLAAAWLSLVADSALCLLPCADRQVAKVRESDGMEFPESLASPSRTQPSTGSKHWLGGSLGTCGLNGFLPSSAKPPLGPLHLNPREIFYKGSGSVLLQDGGAVASGELVCYTDATESGIKDLSGAASVTGAWSSFGTRSKKEKTVLDATNFKRLTTGLSGYSSGIAHKIRFLFVGQEPGRVTGNEWGSRGSRYPAPVLGAPGCLFVISETYRLREKQTTVDVRWISLLGEPSEVSLHQPTASAPESTSTGLPCGVLVYRILIGPQARKLRACPPCRQLLDNCFKVSSDGTVRGPPKLYSA